MLLFLPAVALSSSIALLGPCILSASQSTELAAVLASAHELRSAGSFSEAEAAYRSAADSFPGRAEPLFFAGLAARAAGKEEIALEAYRGALRIDGDLAEAHVRKPPAPLVNAH